MDKMAHAFAAKRITQRWHMVLFFNVTDLSTIAARVAWMKKFPDHNPAKKDSRQQFIITIAEDLCLEQMQRRLQLKTLAKPLRLTMELFVQHIQQKTTCEGRTGGRRKRLAATSRPAAASGAKRSAASTRKSSGTISRQSTTSQSPKNQRNPQGRCCFFHWEHVLAFPAETGCAENMLHMFAQIAHRCCRQRSPTSIATMMNCPEQCPPLPAVIETMVNNKLNTRSTVWAVGKRCLSHLYLWPCRQKRSA